MGALEAGGRGGARGHVVLLARLLQQAGGRDLLGEHEELGPLEPQGELDSQREQGAVGPQVDLGPLGPQGGLGQPESQRQQTEVGLAQRWDTLCRDTLQPLYELHLGYLVGTR